jgi:hypothetical protein
MSSTAVLSPWLPALLALILSAVAVAAAGTMPPGSATKRLGIIGIALPGGLAASATVWQTHIYMDWISNESAPWVGGRVARPQDSLPLVVQLSRRQFSLL